MRKAVFEWISMLVSIVLLGPVAGFLLGSIRTQESGVHATALTSAAPLIGLLLTLCAFTLALVSGVFGTITVGRGMGMACAGFTLVWGACLSGTGEWLLRNAATPSAVCWRLAAESALLAIPALALVALVQRPKPLEGDPNSYPLSEYHGGLFEGLSAIASDRGLIAVAVSAAAAVFGCVLGSISLLKGQCVLSGMFAGICAGCAGGLAIAGVEKPRPALAPYIGVLLVSIGAPIVAVVYHGAALRAAAVTGDLIAPARLVPLDWIAGMFLGTPWGLSWVSGAVKDQLPAGPRASNVRA